jgi:flagellar motor switch protein FliM
MLYSPEELPEEIEDFSFAEAEINVGRFRWLDVVMRRWANQLESTLFDHLHSVFEIEAETVIWTRFNDVLKMLGDQPMYIFESDQKGKGLLILDNTIAQACINRDPDALENTDPLDVTELNSEKQKLLFDIVSQIVTDLEGCWLNIGELPLHLKRITTHPMRAKVMLPFERCVLGTVRFRSEGFESYLIICIPYSVVHPILSKLDDRKVLPPESMDHFLEDVENYLQQLLLDTRYEVKAELGTVELGDRGGVLLKVGQVLPISVPYAGKAIVKINDLPMMIGEAGNSNGKFSVQVTDDFDNLRQTTQSTQKSFQNVHWGNQS